MSWRLNPSTEDLWSQIVSEDFAGDQNRATNRDNQQQIAVKYQRRKPSAPRAPSVNATNSSSQSLGSTSNSNNETRLSFGVPNTKRVSWNRSLSTSAMRIQMRESDLFNEWSVELKAMADRIISMRNRLFDALTAKGDWSHIIKQIGMFTFTGLNPKQVAFMTKEYHIYMTSDRRISMAGLSAQKVPHLADAIYAAVTQTTGYGQSSFFVKKIDV